MKLSYKSTMFACFTGYIVQAIVVNFIPLLFITFQNTYQIPFSQITLLITINFCVQLCVDLLATFFVDRIGYRRAIVLAMACAALGLILLTILPDIMQPFVGILIAVITFAVGGGLMEVLVSPIVEGCPTDNKETTMSLLHSFYCWGYVGVVLISTVFFAVFGIENWKILSLIWAMIPIMDGLLFLKVPIAPLHAEGERGMGVSQLCRNKMFWVFIIMMLCAGASEQAVGQWASAFAERGLGVTKTVGDLAGPLMFAALMGLSRVIYGKFGHRIHMDRFMMGSTALCIFSYLLTALSPLPVLSLIGCGICGFSVGIMWPGTLSKLPGAIPAGGTAAYALLALAGDMGCSAGATVVGFVTDSLNGDMQRGILTAIVFPVVLLICLLISRKKK